MRAGALSLGIALAGCSVAQDAADELARDRAKDVVGAVVADRFPGIDPSPITDCVIDNASAQEILTVAQASVIGVTDQTVTLVLDIAGRPETTRCLAKNAIALL